jgi:hypothetical protein
VNGVISELLFVPGTTSNDTSAHMLLDMMPLDLSVVGSVHSHPVHDLRFSDADLHMFGAKGIMSSSIWADVSFDVVPGTNSSSLMTPFTSRSNAANSCGCEDLPASRTRSSMSFEIPFTCFLPAMPSPSPEFFTTMHFTYLTLIVRGNHTFLYINLFKTL